VALDKLHEVIFGRSWRRPFARPPRFMRSRGDFWSCRKPRHSLACRIAPRCCSPKHT